eukprot:jgi/Botrbrau1/15323/Bobra.0319s0009.1
MTASGWQSQRLIASHIILSDEDLELVHKEFGSDPKQVVQPAPRPSGFTYVDQYGFDMRCGDSLLHRKSKGSANRHIATPTNQDNVKAEKVDKLKQSSSTKAEKSDVVLKPSKDRPLPKGWKVLQRQYLEGQKQKMRTYKVYKSPTGAIFQSYLKAKESWESSGKGRGLAGVTVKQPGVKQQHISKTRASHDGPRDVLPVLNLESLAIWLRGVARTSQLDESRASAVMKRSLLNARAALSLKRPGRMVL